MDLAQTLKPVEQKHPTVEQQFDLKRPINAVDMRYTKQAVKHKQVAKSSGDIDQFTGQTQQVRNGKGKHDCYPVSGKRLKRETTKSIGLVVFSSVIKMTKPLMMKNRFTP